MTPFSYSGNTVTVTDPASSSSVPIWKTIASDVWGNITSVVEPDPSSPTTKTFTTSYAYNIQNSLTKVTMTRGTNTQTRTFSYDPTTFLLTSKTEPETGTTSYTYNADGTTHTKSLANGKGITYNYDSYGRNTGWTGSSGNGSIVKYDQNDIANLSSFTTNAWGRVAYKLVSCPGFYPTYTCAEMYNYTPSGHVTGKKLVVYTANGQNPVALQIEGDFAYYEECSLSSITYPNPITASPMTYTYSFDSMGRPAGMTLGASSVASAATYNPAGQMTALTYGNGAETRAYNSLNQLTNIEAGAAINMQYSYAAGKNNGQITEASDQILGENISYTYDSLKRLVTATASAAPYVKNPSFEQVSFGPSSWTTGSPAANYQNTDQGSHSGTYSLHIQPAGASFSQNFSCQAGATFTVSGWYKLDAQASATVSAQVNSSTYRSSTLNPTSTWTQFTYPFTATSGCGGFPGLLQIGGGAWTLAGGGVSSGTVWFDDLSVTSPSINGGANLLSDPGFETPQSPSWTLNNHSRPTYLSFHGGQTSVRMGAADSATQTVSGAIPNTAYTVSAWCDIPSSSTTATLTVGGAATTANTGSWQLISVPGNSDASGNLAIALSVSNTAGAQVYWDDLTVSTVNPANPTPTWGQSFGYDGFGNLLSETPTAGSAPSLNVTADPATNRVVSTGVQFDAAGNMTNDGTWSYAFDEANRILTVGSYSYTYSGLENKRILVYNSVNASAPTATFNLYGPDGKRLGWYRYGTSNGWTSTTTQGFTNYLYLGNKPLNYAEDRTGSNRSGGSYYPYGNPYGNVNAGAENQSFGTYVQDSGSGLMYADQRYYSPGYGRFMTADRSDANIDKRNPSSWNRFAYTNGDPITGMDPSGQDIVCSGTTPNGEGVASEPMYYATDPGVNSVGIGPDGPVGVINTDNSVTVTDTDPAFNENDGNYSDQVVGQVGQTMVGLPGAGMDFLMDPTVQQIFAFVGGMAIMGGEGPDGDLPEPPSVDLQNFTQKIRNQMIKRGWTAQDIADTVQNGTPYPAINRATGGPATEYVNADGGFVVVDNTTGQVIQVSGPNFLPNYLQQP